MGKVESLVTDDPISKYHSSDFNFDSTSPLSLSGTVDKYQP